MDEEKKKTKHERKIESMPRNEQIERSLVTEFNFPIWRKFLKALSIYQLVQPGDRICVCISGGKDSMLLALLFKHLLAYTTFPFEVKYLVMNPGYNDLNLEVIKENLKTLKIPATIVSTDIFSIANSTDVKPCYLCAKMRRGALYRIAKSWGCNKIALGHHYDDVIVTTLMNMLNAGSFQTMLPKLHSDHYSGMEIIRPLYLVREEDIIAWRDYNHLRFIQCACRFTENVATERTDSQRANTKKLIKELKETYSPMVEKNIFRAAYNVNLNMVLGYKKDGKEVNFLDEYEEEGKKTEQRIKDLKLEEKSVRKAEEEHAEMRVDESLNYLLHPDKKD